MPRRAIINVDLQMDNRQAMQSVDAVVRRYEEGLNRVSRAGSPGRAGGGTGQGAGAASAGTAVAADGSFAGGLLMGWNRAGGFSAAVGTIAKFTAAYKIFDFAAQGVAASQRLVAESLNESWQAWLKYEDVIGKASRTFIQPGVRRAALQDVLGRDALRFMANYRTNIKDIAAAQYELGSADFDAATILQTYNTAVKLSIGLQGDATQTTRTLTQMLKIHGAQMGENISTHDQMVRISGIVAKAWQQEQFELSDLVASYKYVAASAKALKLPLEQVIPILGHLSTYGLRGATAGTALNQMLTQMARTATITDGQIQKLQKSSVGLTETLHLKPGTTRIFDVFQQMSQAMEQSGTSETGRLQALRTFSNMFNIRGARAAMLMMTDFSEILGKVGSAYRMSTADAEKFIQSLIDQVQNTPQGQLELIDNTLRVMGVDFMNAAVGGDTFVTTLQQIHKWLLDTIPVAEAFGAVINIATSGMTAGYGGFFKGSSSFENRHPWISAFTFGAAPTVAGVWNAYRSSGQAQGAAMDNYWQNQYKNMAMDEYTKQIQAGKPESQARTQMWLTLQSLGMTRQGFEQWFGKTESEKKAERDAQVRRMREQMGVVREAMGLPYLESTPKGGGGSKPKLWNPDEVYGYHASRTQYMAWDKVSRGSHREAGVFDILLSEIQAKGQTVDQAMMNIIMQGGIPMFRADMNPQHIHGVMGGMAPKETARLLAQAKGTKWWPLIQQFAGKRTGTADIMGNYIGAMIQQIEDQLTLGEFIPGGGMTKRQGVSAYTALLSTPGLDAGSQARIFTERKRLLDDIADAAEKAAKFQKDVADFREAQKAEGANRILASYDRQLSRVNASERLHGETVDTVREKLDIAKTAQQDYYRAMMEAVGKEGRLSTILQRLQANPANWQDEKGLAKIKEASSDLAALRNEVDQSRGKWLELGDSVKEYQKTLGTLPIQQALDRLGASTGATQRIFGAYGRDYQSSDQRLRDIAEEIRLRSDLAAKMELGSVAQEQEYANIRGMKAEMEAINAVIRPDLLNGWRLQGMQTRTGWIRGNPATMATAQVQTSIAEINLQMSKLHDQYGEWAQADLDAYEQVMKADAIMKPWLEARDQIESEWTNMFTNMFTELSRGDRNAIWSGLDSMIRSFQGQMVQEWVRKNLGGWFDSLAQQRVGPNAGPAGLAGAGLSGQLQAAQAAAESFSSTIIGSSTSLATFSGQTTLATTELGLFTEALSGATGRMVGGGGAPQIGLSGLNLNTKGVADLGRMILPAFEVGLGVLKTKPKEEPKKPTDTPQGNPPATPTTKPKDNSLPGILSNYSTGSMYGGMVGDLLGYDSQSAGIAGGLGYAAGMAMKMTPWGAAALGLAAIFGFGKKKKKPKPDPHADKYGMPEFEWEAYMYNLYQHKEGRDYALGSNQRPWYNIPPDQVLHQNIDNRTIELHVHGGDPKVVEGAVRKVLNDEFGTVPMASARNL